MLNISTKETPKDITQLSDQELIATLAQQARELNIEINLDYHFARQPPAPATDGEDGRVIDIESESGTPAQALAEVQSLSPPNAAGSPTQQPTSGKLTRPSKKAPTQK